MKKMTVTLSEQDLWDMEEGQIFDWDWKTECGEPIKLRIGKGICCDQCCEEFIPKGIQQVCSDCEKENTKENFVCPHCHADNQDMFEVTDGTVSCMACDKEFDK